MAGDRSSIFNAVQIMITGAVCAGIYFSKASIVDALVIGAIGGVTFGLAKRAFVKP